MIKLDFLGKRVLSIVSQADHPMTVNEIYFAINSKEINRNAILARLVSLTCGGLVERGFVFRNDKRVNVYRKKGSR